MKGDPGIIRQLNAILKNELTAISQYFLHARMFRNWGLGELNEYAYRQSIDEMKHADALIERILLLEGLPNLQDLHKLRIGENVQEVLKGDLDLEVASRLDLATGIAACEKAQDYRSRDLLSTMLHAEEDHIGWLEAQLGLIGQVGLQNYLQSQIETDE